MAEFGGPVGALVGSGAVALPLTAALMVGIYKAVQKEHEDRKKLRKANWGDLNTTYHQPPHRRHQRKRAVDSSHLWNFDKEGLSTAVSEDETRDKRRDIYAVDVYERYVRGLFPRYLFETDLDEPSTFSFGHGIHGVMRHGVMGIFVPAGFDVDNDRDPNAISLRAKFHEDFERKMKASLDEKEGKVKQKGLKHAKNVTSSTEKDFAEGLLGFVKEIVPLVPERYSKADEKLDDVHEKALKKMKTYLLRENTDAARITANRQFRNAVVPGEDLQRRSESWTTDGLPHTPLMSSVLGTPVHSRALSASLNNHATPSTLVFPRGITPQLEEGFEWTIVFAGISIVGGCVLIMTLLITRNIWSWCKRGRRS